MSEPVAHQCKVPSYYLEEVRNRTVYRDRPVYVNGEKSEAFCGVMRAVKMVDREGFFQYFSGDTTEGYDDATLIVIDKVFWDCSWKAVRKNDQVRKSVDPEAAKNIGKLPCTCDQMVRTLDALVSKWAYRDRPRVSYHYSGDHRLVNNEYDFCGVRKRVKIEKVVKEVDAAHSNGSSVKVKQVIYYGTDARGNKDLIDPCFYDFNWKEYISSDDEKEAVEDPSVEENKEQEEAAETGPADVIVQVKSDQPPAKAENSGGAQADVAIEVATLDPPPLPPSNSNMKKSRTMDNLSAADSAAQTKTSSPQASPSSEEDARHQKRQETNLCARLCCCFKRCCPRFF
jgi:hypothetical protein